jgi:hypothetical protein
MADRPVPPRSRHPRGTPVPIRIQERDLDILFSLSVGRYLTAPAIEWLHYPGWRERFKAYLERRKTDSTAVYYPKSDVYRRLVALRTGEAPLVHRLVRVAEQGRHEFGRLLDAYYLGVAGARLLCTYRGHELSELWYEEGRERSLKNFEHGVAIGTFYAALRCSLEWSDQALSDWMGDHLLARNDPLLGKPRYDRISVPKARQALAVLPDATFTLRGQRYFLELDRGTTNLKSWAEKVSAYEVYRQHSALRERYQVENFTVLVVAPTPKRMQRIAEEVVKQTRQPTATYLFTTIEKIDPTTIRPSWQEVAQVSWGRRRVGERLVEVPMQLHLTGHPLWSQ